MSDFNKVLASEYSEQFDKERKSRIITSFYKYGAARDNFGGGRVDAIATAGNSRGSQGL